MSSRLFPASDRLLVIGASSGGVAALIVLVGRLPRLFPAPVCVVLHVGNHLSILPEILSSKGQLPAVHPHDGQALRPGSIFVAPPDRHMCVDGRVVMLRYGPKVHFARPAIDPLFTSAARSYGAGTIGVILTGALDDGAEGMAEIERRGGVSIAQDPEEAETPSMPIRALERARSAHRMRLAAIPAFLLALVEGRGQGCNERNSPG